MTPDAPRDVGHGPYPVVVFVHGFAVTPRIYAELLSRWASAGYVVVAPAIPLLNGDAPGGASHDDYPTANLADLQFVVGEVLRRSGVSTDVLYRLVDPLRVAVTGHSDGELLADLSGFGSCCRDNRVRSVIAMAGNLGNVNLLPEASGVPLLHMISENDEYDPTVDACWPSIGRTCTPRPTGSCCAALRIWRCSPIFATPVRSGGANHGGLPRRHTEGPGWPRSPDYGCRRGELDGHDRNRFLTRGN